MDISKPNIYTTVVRLLRTEIDNINLVLATSSKETINSCYGRIKPDLLINGGFFNMVDGKTLNFAVDEGKSVGANSYSRYGFFTKADKSFGFANFSATGFKDFIGGTPWLIANGVINETMRDVSEAIRNTKNPRSAIGMDDKYFFIVAVDGRQTNKPGMTLPQLALFMKGLGCTDAINLDGGGSTHLGQGTASGLKILNSPTENRLVDNHVCFFLEKPVQKASTGKHVTINTAVLRIRKSPSVISPIVGSYARYTVVEVLEEKNGWYRTSAGWISSKYTK
jgi:exopolysaccharide biosynthesis protein